MKTIGLLGGLSWESSAEYYRIINQTVKERLGGLHSAPCLMYSFDFAEIEALQMRDDWDEATARMIAAARQLERGGAECLVICSNTMHKMANAVQNAIDMPLLHIADPTAEAAKEQGVQQIALLGTRFTMEQAFFIDRLSQQHGLTVMVPDDHGRGVVHDIIYNELVVGKIKDTSRQRYQNIIGAMVEDGAQGVILGCTEIGLLIQQEHATVPVFDTTHLHAVAAVDWALNEH